MISNITNIMMILLVWSLLFIVIQAARSSGRTKKSKEDLAEERLYDLSMKTISSPILYLSDRNFSSFVTEKPRYYHAAIFLTASNPKYQCMPCAQSQQVWCSVVV